MNEDQPGSDDPTIPSPLRTDHDDPTLRDDTQQGDTLESDWAKIVAPGSSVAGFESGGERYTITGQLGEGGYGEVLEVVDARMQRRVALKRMRSGSGEEASFLQEARVTGRLDHPNVVPVHDIGVDAEGRAYYTMKRIEGGSLEQRIRAEDLGGLVERLQIFLKICDAIGFAHAQGLVHRDLKPANIMVGGYGEVLVADWGLARPIGAPGSQGADPASGSSYTDAVGTPGYMPPEQARGDARLLDERTDIFALGAVLHVLLTGQVFYSDARVALYHASLDNPAPVSPVGLLFPREIRGVVVKACSPASGDRYQTVGKLRDEIVRFMEDVPLVSVRYSMLDRWRRWMRHHRGLVLGAGAVLTTAALLLAISGTIYVRDVQEAQRATELQQRETERQLGLTEVAQAMVLLEGSRAEEGLSLAQSALGRLEGLGIDSADVSLSVRLYGQLQPGRYLRWKAGTRRFRSRAVNADGTRALVAFGSVVSLWSLPEARRIADWTVPEESRGLAVAFVGGQPTAFWMVGDTLNQVTIPDGKAVRSYSPTERFQVFAYRGVLVVYDKDGGHQAYDLRSGEGMTLYSGPEVVLQYASQTQAVAVGKTSDLELSAGRTWTWLVAERRYETGPDDRLVLSNDGRFLFHKRTPRENSAVTSARSVLSDLDSGAEQVIPDVTDRALFSPDASVLVTTTGKNQIVVRETESGATRVRARSVGRLHPTLSATGDRLLAHTEDGDLLLYLLDGEGAPVQVPVSGDPGLTVEFSQDGVLVAVSGFNQPVSLFETGTRRLLARFGPTPGGVRDLAFSRGDVLLAAAGRDGRATIWNVADGTLSAAHAFSDQRVCSLDWLDPSTLVVLGCKGRLVRWTMGSPPTPLQQLDGVTWRVRKTPVGTLVVTQREGLANMVVLDAATGTILATNSSDQLRTEPRYGLTISPDGKLAAVSSGVGVFHVHDTGSLASVAEFGTAFGPGLGVVFHPTRPLLVTSTDHGELVFWDTATWQRLSTVQAHSGGIADLAVSADGRWLASTGADGNLAVFDLHGPLPWEASEAVVSPLGPGEVLSDERRLKLGQSAAVFGAPKLALELLGDDLSALDRARLMTLRGDEAALGEWKRSGERGAVSPAALALILEALDSSEP